MKVRIEFKGDIPSINLTEMEMEDTYDVDSIREKVIKQFGKEPKAFSYIINGIAHGYRDWRAS